MTPLLVLFLAAALAQSGDTNDLARATALLEAAVRARGGDAYLNVRTEVGTGQYNRYEKGVSTVPVPFADYIQYPDKERTEFGKKKNRFIQANVGATGWTFDSTSKAIKDQPEEQTRDFVEGMRYGLDGVLRGSWRAAGVKVSYLGRREAWRLRFGEAVRVEFPDNNVVTLYFDFNTRLPILLVREHTDKDQPVKEETQFHQWVDRQGVLAPNIIDFYRDGVQVSRIIYDNLSYNQPIPADFFAKPANAKDIK